MKMYDDSTGKHKLSDVRARSALLSAVFILGVCLGVVAAEKLYLATQEAQTSSAGLQSLRTRSQKLEQDGSGGSGSGAVAAAVIAVGEPQLFQKGKQPRNDLETLLQRVAPDGEVMIAISNMNLIREDSLKLWLKVSRE